MSLHTKDYKDKKWHPSIQGQVADAMRTARSREELMALLQKGGIDVVFRENEAGRIYGVTFIDHNRREVFNGSRLGKDFSANVFNELFNRWEETPETERAGHTGTELEQAHYRKAEQAAGIFSLEQNPATDYEEEAFRRRMQRKKKKRKGRGL